MASMKEVAARAGVSISTVSHVVNNTRYVLPETMQRVHQAIEEVGFHPNAAARLLACGTSNVFGLIISDIANPFFPELVKAFEAAALAAGYEILLANTNYEPSRMVDCVKRMIMGHVSGVAIMTSEIDPALTESLRRHHVPVVYLDVGMADTFASNILVDYDAGIREAVEHLSSLGHMSVGFITGPENLRSSRERRQAFERCVSRLGMRYMVEIGDMKEASGEEAARKLLTVAEAPTAIIAANDFMALGALRAIRAAGMQIPDDLSVIGFDDILFASLTEPPLTTVELSRADLGTVATNALIQLCQSEDHAGSEYRVGTRLVVRQSTTESPSAAVGPRAARSRPRRIAAGA